MSNGVIYQAGNRIAPGDLVTGYGTITGRPYYGRYVGPNNARGESKITEPGGGTVLVLTGSLRRAD